MASLADPLQIAGLELRNRLYRAPLLECAGTGPDAVDTLIRELEPAAASGAGFIHQGATIVTEEGGCAAPQMTRVADPDFVNGLSALTDRIHDHGASIAIQLEHGGLRAREIWHHGFEGPGYQLAVSRPPWPLRLLDRLGALDLQSRIMSTEAVYELAAAFGRSAEMAVDAGYDAVHLAGANMGIIQQFCSPFFNGRDDEFGVGPDGFSARFLEVVHDEIRERAGDVPLLTKVPAETAAPPFVRSRLSLEDGVELCRQLERIGFDAVVPVCTSTFWDASVVRGAYPARSWSDRSFRNGYRETFGGRLGARLAALGNRVESWVYDFEPGWNEAYCRRVSEAVSIPVLMEGGIRDRSQIDRLLDEEVCNAVGMARPFYAEPRLPARLLAGAGAAAVCESCNNCVVPQVTGARGVCRTPAVLRETGQLERAGAYDAAGGE